MAAGATARMAPDSLRATCRPRHFGTNGRSTMAPESDAASMVPEVCSRIVPAPLRAKIGLSMPRVWMSPSSVSTLRRWSGATCTAMSIRSQPVPSVRMRTPPGFDVAAMTGLSPRHWAAAVTPTKPVDAARTWTLPKRLTMWTSSFPASAADHSWTRSSGVRVAQPASTKNASRLMIDDRCIWRLPVPAPDRWPVGRIPGFVIVHP